MYCYNTAFIFIFYVDGWMDGWMVGWLDRLDSDPEHG